MCSKVNNLLPLVIAGFMSKNGRMVTYLQQRDGLSYFYAKRKVLDNSVDSSPLDL